MRGCARIWGRAALLISIVCVGLVPSGAGAAAVAAPDWSQVRTCSDYTRSVVRLTATGYVVRDANGYSWDQRFMSAGTWAHPPAWDAVHALHAYGMTWSAPLLRELAETQDAARLRAFVGAFAATPAWRPDTGGRHDPVWNEQVVTRRLQAGLCLYRVTADPRLLPVLKALGEAASDPERYYGPPRFPVHNHGLLANRMLLELGWRLGWDRFVVVALRRMRADIDLAFTAAGHSVEQSSAYHVMNAASWRSAASQLLEHAVSAPLGRRILDVVARARRTTSYLAMPDRVPVPFGDLEADPAPVRPQASTTFADPQAGVLTGRWSWTDPTDWYAAKFGGHRWGHGHVDSMSVVWWARSRPVLVDPGTATYVHGRLRDWARSLPAHSAPLVRGRVVDPWATVDLESRSVGPGIHSFTLNGRPFQVDQRRTVVVDPARHRLTLLDTAAGPLAVVLQLDSRWRVVATWTHRVVLSDPGGARLVIATSGTVVSVRRGQDRLDGGWMWTYPPPGRVPAARVVIHGGGTTRTTLTVLGAPPVDSAAR